MTEEELKRLLEAQAAETRRHFDATVDRLSAENRHFFEIIAEGLQRKVELVAEGVTDTRELLARQVGDIRDEMQRGFPETQAMIRFSHTELDQRVRVLEESQRNVAQTLADVQARLERLEGSTH